MCPQVVQATRLFIISSSSSSLSWTHNFDENFVTAPKNKHICIQLLMWLCHIEHFDIHPYELHDQVTGYDSHLFFLFLVKHQKRQHFHEVLTSTNVTHVTQLFDEIFFFSFEIDDLSDAFHANKVKNGKSTLEIN